MLPILPTIFLPNVLYAEIHYRFKYFFSFLNIKEPEIIFDFPERLEPTANFPLMLFVKDGNKYPIQLLSVNLEIIYKNKIIKNVIFKINKNINTQFWFYIFNYYPDKSTPFGDLEINATAEVKINNKIKIIKNDNYRTTNKKSFKFYRSQTKLNSNPKFKFGDIHYHSNYTNDQVEFGAPIEATKIIAKCIGLDYFAVTDHSYDLDDKIDNYLINDSELLKWNNFQKEIDHLNSKDKDIIIIRGEEVSCRNANGSNVHLLLLGNEKYIHGSGDSAEKWFKTKSEYSIEEVLNEVPNNVLAIAAHPKEFVPFLQKLFFNRNVWSDFDLFNFKLNGMQILNGELNESFFSGKISWINLIQQGSKIKIYSGNDAHGNFNRFRQLKIPFINLIEKDYQLFGRMKTAIRSKSKNEKLLLKDLKNNYSVITSGPLLNIQINKNKSLTIEATSTSEFGKIIEIKIIIQNTKNQNEEVIISLKTNGKYNFKKIIKLLNYNTINYIRGELKTINGNGTYKNNFCYTNPIWINDAH